jgi:P-type conjugative transfer protein TrbJ
MRRRTILLLSAATAVAAAPAAAVADIVIDPANLAQAVVQVAQDVQLVEQFRQQVQNGVAMVKGWGYTRLPDLMRDMAAWQQVFAAGGSPYGSADPGPGLDQRYPTAPGDYAGDSDAAMAARRAGWDAEDRSVLVENRTVQDAAYAGLKPTAERVGDYVRRGNSAPGVTAAIQAGNETLATLVAQLQALQAQELTDGRGEVERLARDQAESAYADHQRQAVRAGWDRPAAASGPVDDAFPSAQN